MSEKNPKNLLLVDDDDIRIEPLIDFLKDVGFKVFHAQSPVEAWKHLEDENIKIDLIVMDLIIPTRGAYSKKICPEPERCGEVFLNDLRDLKFENELISEDEHKKREKVKKKYKDVPVVVFTARNIERFELDKTLKKKPLNAIRVDSKRIFDYEKYAQELMSIVNKI